MSVKVDVAADGLKGLSMAREKEYDLIILDLMLPGIDGFEVVKRLRDGGSATPILILTARDGVHDRINGLQVGADDYLVKPYSFSELLARIRIILRRHPLQQPETMRMADLELDLVRHKARRGSVSLDLTVKEFQLLALMLRRRGEVLSRTTIS